MASINLTPKLTVIIGQAILFVIAYIIVNKWIVIPFRILKAHRDNASKGSKQDTSEILTQIHQRHKIIDEKSSKAILEVQKIRSEAMEKAHHQSIQIIDNSKKQAQKIFDQNHQDLSNMIASEQTKLKHNSHQIFDDLKKKVFD